MQMKPLFFAIMVTWSWYPVRLRPVDRREPDAILHDKVPTLTSGLIAAEVEITTDIRSAGRPPLEARIISMIQGKYAGSLMRIEPQVISSCDGFPYPGQRGVIVGRVLTSSEVLLVVDPVRAPSASSKTK